MIKEGDRFLVRVKMEERYQNLNLMIKDFAETTGLAASEDYCIRDNQAHIVILNANLLVKGGIYRICHSDNMDFLRKFRKEILTI